MKIHNPRMVKEYKLITCSGKQVYNFGRSFTLESANHRLPTYTIDNPNSNWNQKKLQKVAEILGESCKWEYFRMAEVMGVSF